MWFFMSRESLEVLAAINNVGRWCWIRGSVSSCCSLIVCMSASQDIFMYDYCIMGCMLVVFLEYIPRR